MVCRFGCLRRCRMALTFSLTLVVLALTSRLTSESELGLSLYPGMKLATPGRHTDRRSLRCGLHHSASADAAEHAHSPTSLRSE